MRPTHLLLAHLLCASLATAQEGTWFPVGGEGLTSDGVLCCQVAFDGTGIPYVAYQDKSFPHRPTTVMRYVDGDWQVVGSAGGASIDRGWYNHLAFDAADQPWVVSRDYGIGGRANVRRYDSASGQWVNVGPFGLSPDHAHYTHLVMGPGDVPYVTFQDFSTTPPDRASVMRFRDGGWEYVGPPGLTSSGAVGYPSLAVDPQGVVHVAFSDGPGGGRATVLRYVESSATWEPVGPPAFSHPSALHLRLAIDGQGAPHVAYVQYGSRIVVQRFDGTSWVQVGDSASGPDRPALETELWRQWLSFEFDPADRPFVAYQSIDQGHQGVVRMFDGSEWVAVGGAAGTGHRTDYMAMALDPSGQPWLAFRDGPGGNSPLTVLRHAPGPATYCEALPNSTGVPAEISWQGSPSVAANDLVLLAHRLPPSTPGVFVYSPDETQVPLGNGHLCLGSDTLGFLVRLPLLVADEQGAAAFPLDLLEPPTPVGAITAGSTWSFTYLYRDPDAGNAGFNFSDGLRVLFVP